MQSLAQLSADKILSSLPGDCLDILASRLIKDRVYNLATYVTTQEIPQDGCFLVFSNNHNGFYTCLGLTCHVASLSFLMATEAGFSFHAYHIPSSPLNVLIEVPAGDLIPTTTQVTVTCLDRELNGMLTSSFREIRKTTATNLESWKDWDCPQVPIQYWIPKV